MKFYGKGIDNRRWAASIYSKLKAPRRQSDYACCILLERDRLWHVRPKGESKTFKRMKRKLECYMRISLEGKQ